ncbi:hypothetical protein [Oscillatoria acuminata]|uniref:hypothetical protein n=1 Tax=Oscillatoria acuminata TaxID=118323 RepID=UPI0002D5E736|nr:hypothetical protein [Oscillatoria acuminata]
MGFKPALIALGLVFLQRWKRGYGDVDDQRLTPGKPTRLTIAIFAPLTWVSGAIALHLVPP